jgi:hypothetical protein
MTDINETAVRIAAEIAGVYVLMVEYWIQGALAGAEPLPANTLEYRAWVAYRAAVAMERALSQPESAGQ